MTQLITGDGPLGTAPPQTDSGLPGPADLLSNDVILGPGPAQFDQGLPGPGNVALGTDVGMIIETDSTLPGPGQGQDNLDLVGPGESPGGSLENQTENN